MAATFGSDDESPGYDSDSSEASTGYDTDQLEQGSESDDDCDSVVGYDYSFDNMRQSKPFKAPIVIGSQVVNAVFDTGASVSIISGNLARRLGLKTNGDKLTLTSFDDRARHDCKIVDNVPIRVGGKLRPEHMCVQEGARDDLCLLGMTWFKHYGVKQDLESGTILVPTMNGSQCVELVDWLYSFSRRRGVSLERSLGVIVVLWSDHRVDRCPPSFLWCLPRCALLFGPQQVWSLAVVHGNTVPNGSG
ncbi:hypothetical protein [Absidia glauca]|uniref:Uncharacterized protein n=1 Tax=Absidia glauca TaxID=4829 RepID=A0A168PYC4_ABSGL|nr:hypothetical protein [Absidia glauca]